MNESFSIFGVPLEIVTFAFTAITTSCALFVSFVALRHMTKPRIEISPILDSKYFCGKTAILKFKVVNRGYWYVHPMVVNLELYCNFGKDFKLFCLSYGSRQEKKDTIIKYGVENMQYFKAEKIILGREKCGEDFTIEIEFPQKPGKHLVKFDAFSENGVSYKKELELECIAQKTIEKV